MEEWKIVYGSKIHYCVSDLGRFWSSLSGVIYPSQFKSGYGYLTFRVNGQNVRKYAHRVVALAFIENPDNKKCVNHKNGIKSDNRVLNLEWATHSENNTHSYRVLKNPPVSSRLINIIAYREDMTIVLEFEGVRCASRSIDINRTSIRYSIKNNTITKSGWKFEYL